jgi:U6 snRNA-associated Sm-like protein LSm7
MNRRTDNQHRANDDKQGGDTKKDRPKKESIIDLSKFVDKIVRVKFQGGREATGKLKGYDHLLNLVLDDATEYMRDSDESYRVTETKRHLGLVVCRGPAVTVVCPQDGHESIQNPFLAAD